MDRNERKPKVGDKVVITDNAGDTFPAKVTIVHNTEGTIITAKADDDSMFNSVNREQSKGQKSWAFEDESTETKNYPGGKPALDKSGEPIAQNRTDGGPIGNGEAQAQQQQEERDDRRGNTRSATTFGGEKHGKGHAHEEGKGR